MSAVSIWHMQVNHWDTLFFQRDKFILRPVIRLIWPRPIAVPCHNRHTASATNASYSICIRIIRWWAYWPIIRIWLLAMLIMWSPQISLAKTILTTTDFYTSQAISYCCTKDNNDVHVDAVAVFLDVSQWLTIVDHNISILKSIILASEIMVCLRWCSG